MIKHNLAKFKFFTQNFQKNQTKNLLLFEFDKFCAIIFIRLKIICKGKGLTHTFILQGVGYEKVSFSHHNVGVLCERA